MFAFGDPTGTGALSVAGALSTYQTILHGSYREFGRTPNSAFTIPEAFEEMSAGAQSQVAVVPWLAFPKSVAKTALEIDNTRFRFQDEYVEWKTMRDSAGRVTRVIFTTEFPEYYEALAAANVDALLAEVRKVTESQAVTIADLFGPGFKPNQATAEGRARRFRQRAEQNPWNSSRSILFLTHRDSTLGALFRLAAECAVARQTGSPSDTCAAVEGACVPSRNSDPAICTAVQDLARNQNSFTFDEPVGVVIQALKGIWKLNGTQIDINASNLWKVERNGRRGTLDVPPGLTIIDNEIETGTEVAAKLSVAAKVRFAPDSLLPEWSRMGHESSRDFPE